MELRPKKLTFFILGSIFIGALGSGLWDIAIKPLFYWLGRVSLTIITLGISSLKDAIYKDVATGLVETPSITVMIFMVGGITGVVFSLITRGIRKIRLKENKPKGQIKTNRKFWVLIVVLTILTTVINLQMFAHVYVNRTVGFFNQSFLIIKPYVDNQEEENILSEYSQIKSKDDFIIVMDKIQKIARKEGITLPQFDIW